MSICSFFTRGVCSYLSNGPHIGLVVSVMGRGYSLVWPLAILYYGRAFLRRRNHTLVLSRLPGVPPGDEILITKVVWTASSAVSPSEPGGFGLDPAGPGMHPAVSSVSSWAAVCPSMPGLIPRWPDVT